MLAASCRKLNPAIRWQTSNRMLEDTWRGSDQFVDATGFDLPVDREGEVAFDQLNLTLPKPIRSPGKLEMASVTCVIQDKCLSVWRRLNS